MSPETRGVDRYICKMLSKPHLFFETVFHAAQAGFKLCVAEDDLRISCLHLLSAGIIDEHHHARFIQC